MTELPAAQSEPQTIRCSEGSAVSILTLQLCACVCVCGVERVRRPVCLVAVCVMCYVVMVSAGRNVLESVPPTRRPPTHGRLSASIPLALPARHNLLSAYLNPHPAFMPLFFSVSGVPPLSIRIVILPLLQLKKKTNSPKHKTHAGLLAIAFAGIINATHENGRGISNAPSGQTA